MVKQHKPAKRDKTLKRFPIETRGKKTSDGQDYVDQVYDFHYPYWRVRYQDDDWEELSKREMEQLRATDEGTTKL